MYFSQKIFVLCENFYENMNGFCENYVVGHVPCGMFHEPAF